MVKILCPGCDQKVVDNIWETKMYCKAWCIWQVLWFASCYFNSYWNDCKNFDAKYSRSNAEKTKPPFMGTCQFQIIVTVRKKHYWLLWYCNSWEAPRYWHRFSQSDEWCKAIKGNFERITSNSRYASCSMALRIFKNCRRQWCRDSYDKVVKDKYKKSVSITFLDDLITELDTRFSSDAVTFYNDFFNTCCYVFKWPKELSLWYWIYSEKICYDLFEISRRWS